jgi:hypothetical protein
MTRHLLIALATSLAACAAPSDREAEIARVHAHLDRVEAELAARAVPDLSRDQYQQRSSVIDHLHEYIVAERYPTNDDVTPYSTPIFIDDQGARCAMAALIEASGNVALVERIARDHNYAYIDDLSGDRELQQWLGEHGISLREAARIQPSYANTTASRWAPTISAEGGAQAGASSGSNGGAQGWLSLGVRIGARRITHSNSSCDDCVYKTTALVAEYEYISVPTTGTAHQVGLLVQRDLNQQAQDHQRYVVAGAIFAFGGGSVGDGVGVEAGYGMSLRNRSLPVFGEVIAAALTQPGGGAVHAGIDIGVVW